MIKRSLLLALFLFLFSGQKSLVLAATDNCSQFGISNTQGFITRKTSSEPHVISILASGDNQKLKAGDTYQIKIFKSQNYLFSSEDSKKIVAQQVTDSIPGGERKLNTASFQLVETDSLSTDSDDLHEMHYVYLYPEVAGPNFRGECYLGAYQVLKRGITETEIAQLTQQNLLLDYSVVSCGNTLDTVNNQQCNCSNIEGSCCGWRNATDGSCGESAQASQTNPPASQPAEPTPQNPAQPAVTCGELNSEGTVCKIVSSSSTTHTTFFETCSNDKTKCCKDPGGATACSSKYPVAQDTPEQITAKNCGSVESGPLGSKFCKIGNQELPSFDTCSNGTCCRQGNTNFCPTDSSGGGDDTGSADDQVDPPFQGPTVATFNALNPLITEGSDQATRLSTPGGIVTRFLVFAFPIAGLILFVMLSWAGFEILTGASNQKSLDAGKQRATAAIVGFLLLFASYWLMQIVEVIFGISIL